MTKRTRMVRSKRQTTETDAFHYSNMSLRMKIAKDNDDYSSPSSTTSLNFAMDPTSDQGQLILRTHLGLSKEQHQRLAALSVLVVDWNRRINLVSRRDCTRDVVFGRHILPSLAPLGMKNKSKIKNTSDTNENDKQEKEDEEETAILKRNTSQKIVDVGTGGGFPGLPLAIAYPQSQFLLVDSVGKKLTAVQDMANRLGLTNVQTYHGRAEDLFFQKQEEKFHVCVGRSVAAIPTYCFWIQNLLRNDGHLLYMIGGDIEKKLLDHAIIDEDIDDLLNCPGASDKRVLVFPTSRVKAIAAESGETWKPSKRTTAARFGKSNQQQQQPQPPKKRSKGEWVKRDATATKKRGYEKFQRYDSLNP